MGRTKVLLTPVPLIVEIEIQGDRMVFPDDIQQKIENYWTEINLPLPRFTRGQIFHVVKKEVLDEKLKVTVVLTDYAHYLYTVKKGLSEPYACKVMYGVNMIVTADNYIVVGEMDRHTAYAGRLQFVGGSLDENDREGNRLSLLNSIRRETKEEIGIDLEKENLSLTPWVLKEGGDYDFTVLICKTTLGLTKDIFSQRYECFVRELENKGEIPEFQALHFITNTKEDIQRFLEENKKRMVDYLSALLNEI